MKTVNLIVIAIAGAIPTAASAQLVHLAMEGSFVFTTPPVVPVFKVLSDPAPFRIDAYYHANIPGESIGDFTLFPAVDWSRDYTDQPNFLRWRSENADFTVPIVNMRLSHQHDFTLSYSTRVPSLSVVLHLAPENQIDRLPVPPFTLSPRGAEFGTMGSYYVSIEGGSFFMGTITSVDAEFVPVPEPTMYAGIAAVGLIGVIFVRRLSRKVQLKPAQPGTLRLPANSDRF